MKILKKMLLIHWHYFIHETIEFDFVNFLTGKNASGKSTIIDALQLVLLADTAGNSFNKAASGKNSRTLRGYLLGELGDDEGSGFKYLRNGNFSSYVALEFYDDDKDAWFTAGCCFDVYSENDYPRLFFRFNGRIPDHAFLDKTQAGQRAMDSGALRSWLRGQYTQGSFFTTDTNIRFEEDLCAKLGALQVSRFTQLFKRAVSFNPDVDIQKFISEFVCDTPQIVDVSGLQENIRSYTRLEAEEAVLRERSGELERIAAVYESFDTQRKGEKLYTYLIKKAEHDIKQAAIQQQIADALRFVENIKRLTASIDESKKTLEQTKEEREELHDRLMNNETARVVEDLEKHIRIRNEEIKGIKETFDRNSRQFLDWLAQWKPALTAIGTLTRFGTHGVQEKEQTRFGFDMNVFDPLLASLIGNLCEAASRFASSLEDFHPENPVALMSAGENALKSRLRAADSLRIGASKLEDRLLEEKEKQERQRRDLEAEERTLKNGVYPFPAEVLDLKEAIAGRLRLKNGNGGGSGNGNNVFVVAEVAEIPEDRWRNVIEGYLHTQKFYLVVPPEHFSTALQVYDAIKRKRAVYGTGLVDIEKIGQLAPRAEAGSLAKEIMTDNPFVRLFLDYTLGRVMKCDKLSALRNFKTSVTDEGMLYQNYTARAMNPVRWAKPAIGQDAVRRRILAVRRELDRLAETLAALERVYRVVVPLGGGPVEGGSLRGRPCQGLVVPGEGEADGLLEAAAATERIPRLEEEIAVLRDNLAAVDRSEIEAAQERIQTLKRAEERIGGDLETARREQGRDEGLLTQINEHTLPRLKEELAVMEAHIAEHYDADWIEATGEPRYQKELTGRLGPDKIYEAFQRELSRSKNAKEKFWDELKESRRIYNDRYKMGYDTGAENNEVWENARRELGENKLPEYRAKIEDARNKAYEQFREDFLSRLQNNINNAKQQIAALNAALSSSFFGDDRYKFLIFPKPEYKPYHDMIVDPMLMEGGYNLLSEQFNAKYHVEIANLFTNITGGIDERQAEGRDDYEKRVQTFTDYRNYLSFDLEVTNSDGESQRLSRTMAKKSGGETQTPFYIAVLASFTQLYRVGRDRKAGTARLIVFDEAFSKMDSERITSSIELLRALKFQVILSAPSDKIGDITPLADRSLLVFRDKKRSSVVSFDKTKIDMDGPHAP
jgi:energy-coupling factor transporter ATP-binding protein EcfA2